MVPQDYRYALIHEVTKRNHLRQEVAVALVTYTPLAHAERRASPKIALRVRVRVVFETSNVQVKDFDRKSGLTYEDEKPNKVVASCKPEFVTREVTWCFGLQCFESRGLFRNVRRQCK